MDPFKMSEEALARLVTGLRAAAPLARNPVPVADPLFLRLRRGGRSLWINWYKGGDLVEALGQALARDEAKDADVLEVALTHNYREIPRNDFAKAFANAFRGRRGIEISCGHGTLRRSPLQMITTNRRFRREFEDFLEKYGISEGTFWRDKGRIQAFGGRQLLFMLKEPVRCVELFRGNRVVSPAAVGPDMVRELAGGMVDWMLANTRKDGHLTYKYWPSRGEESDADNTIRRFMATVALFRAARTFERRDVLDAADRNLRFNLKRFYVEVDGLGGIEWDGSIKLGAVALAALSIFEHPDRAPYEETREKLSACVEHLWQPDGSFRTFLRPDDRDDNHNFYPGEALLYWAHLHSETHDPALLDRFMKSYRYYRDWHLANRNPAFIPWHAQACAMVYQQTGETELRDWVFEMNDWLLPMQQWGAPLAPDLWGRFYDPRNPQYGPPHASSTGVYLEGLADALRLARDCGDADRAAVYERAVWRAVRSLRQLQFTGETDAFYITKRDPVLGGLRTETYNNEIRVDNVQHGLMGLLKLSDLLDIPFDG
ncbi:MAG: hypothetical protein ACTSQV_06385 [Alphaproteobacteria bacterium]